MMYKENRNIKLKYNFDIENITYLKIHSFPIDIIKKLTINNKHSKYDEKDVNSFYGCDLNNMIITSVNIISFFYIYIIFSLISYFLFYKDIDNINTISIGDSENKLPLIEYENNTYYSCNENMNYVVDRNGIFVKCYINKENEMIYNKIIPYIPIDNNENKKELKSFENALKIMGLCFRNVIENSHNPSIYNNNYNYIADIILNYTCRISQNGYANFSKDFISQFVPDYNQLVFIYILFK